MTESQFNTVSKNTPLPQSVPESGGKTKTHGYSFDVSVTPVGKTKIGQVGALVLRFLANIQRTGGRNVGAKRWVSVKLDTLNDQYPYTGRGSIDEALGRLKEAGAIEVRAYRDLFGTPRYNRTNCFHVPSQWANMAEQNLRYFDVDTAAQLGVIAAVILRNFHCLLDDYGTETVVLRPTDVAERQGISVSTAKRAIKDLKKVGYLYPVDGTLCGYAEKPVENQSSKVDQSSSKLDEPGSKLDLVSSKSDNDSIEIYIKDSLEDYSKRQPSAAFEKSLCAEKQLQESDNTSSAVPTPDEQYPAERIVSFSPFAQLISTSATQHLPTTEVINQSAEEIPLSNPDISSFAQLHAINRSNSNRLNEASTPDRDYQALRQIAKDCIQHFFRTSGYEVADDLYQNASHDEAFEALVFEYRRCFSCDLLDETPFLFNVVYHGSLELIIRALTDTDDTREKHPIHQMHYESMALRRDFYARADACIEEDLKAEFAQRRSEFASIDRVLEDDPEIAPAQKARIFRQGINEMNRVGWVCLGETELATDRVNTKGALKRIEQLFSENPLLTPRHLLDIMEKCVALHSSWPLPPAKYRPEIKWHARNAHKLSIFANNLENILDDLGIFCPVIGLTLDDEEMEMVA